MLNLKVKNALNADGSSSTGKFLGMKTEQAWTIGFILVFGFIIYKFGASMATKEAKAAVGQ